MLLTLIDPVLKLDFHCKVVKSQFTTLCQTKLLCHLSSYYRNMLNLSNVFSKGGGVYVRSLKVPEKLEFFRKEPHLKSVEFRSERIVQGIHLCLRNIYMSEKQPVGGPVIALRTDRRHASLIRPENMPVRPVNIGSQRFCKQAWSDDLYDRTA